MPIAQLSRQIAPRTHRALQMQHGPTNSRSLTTGARARILGREQGGFELFPELIVEQSTHGMFKHPELQSVPRSIVRTKIREHCLPSPVRVVARGIGPSLANAGVANSLQDPMLQLVDANGDVIAENDDYGTSNQRAEIRCHRPRTFRPEGVGRPGCGPAGQLHGGSCPGRVVRKASASSRSTTFSSRQRETRSTWAGIAGCLPIFYLRSLRSDLVGARPR